MGVGSRRCRWRARGPPQRTIRSDFASFIGPRRGLSLQNDLILQPPSWLRSRKVKAHSERARRALRLSQALAAIYIVIRVLINPFRTRNQHGRTHMAGRRRLLFLTHCLYDSKPYTILVALIKGFQNHIGFAIIQAESEG